MLRAAVVIALIGYESPAFLVVRRAAHLRRNPGEIAFPGGLVDDGDAGEEATALRELEEELGIPRERVRVVDRLDDVETLALSVTVTPFVGTIAPPVSLEIDAREIASVHEVPVRALYVPGALHRGTEPVERGGKHYDVPTWLFDFEGLHIWGATARMLESFLRRYPELASVPRPEKV
jgi:8-oxo-dGTP pyrophosphatase MutT (NUDIX family)